MFVSSIKMVETRSMVRMRENLYIQSARERIHNSIQRFHKAAMYVTLLFMIYMGCIAWYIGLKTTPIYQTILLTCTSPFVHTFLINVIQVHYYHPFQYKGVEYDLMITRTFIIY